MRASTILLNLAAVVVILSVFSGCACLKKGESSQYVHFFVAPKSMQDGSSASDQLDALRIWLSQKAGGYTEFSSAPGGWLTKEKKLDTARQVAFLVSADINMKSDLIDYMKVHFKQNEPYVEVWTALP